MTRRALGALILIATALGGVFAWNFSEVQKPVAQTIAGDPRNAGIEVRAHFGRYVESSTLVFDLRGVSEEKSPADVFRVLLQCSEALKQREFSRVELRHRGVPKFVLDGEYFRELGQDYGNQNPVYTMRTFSSHLRHPDGSAAFGEWTGGLLGVVKEQMEDFEDFHKQWYLTDLQ